MQIRRRVPTPLRSRSALTHWVESQRLALRPPTELMQWLDRPEAMEEVRATLDSHVTVGQFFTSAGLTSPERRAWAYARWGGQFARFPLPGDIISEMVQWAVRELTLHAHALHDAPRGWSPTTGDAHAQAVRVIQVRSRLAASTPTDLPGDLADGLMWAGLTAGGRFARDTTWLFVRSIPAHPSQIARYEAEMGHDGDGERLRLMLATHPSASALWAQVTRRGIAGDDLGALLVEHPSLVRHHEIRSGLLSGDLPLSPDAARVLATEVTPGEMASLLSRLVTVPGGTDVAFTILTELTPELRRDLVLSPEVIHLLDSSAHPGGDPGTTDTLVPPHPVPEPRAAGRRAVDRLGIEGDGTASGGWSAR